MKIINKEWNSELKGFICTLDNGKIVQVQFSKEENRLHGGAGLYFPEIDKTNEYGLDLSDDELIEFENLMNSDRAIIAKANELDNQ